MPEISYKISIYAIGPHDSVAITQEHYEEIRRAHELIIFGVAIEEKLDLLVENYAELERELLDMAVQHCVFSGAIGELLSEARHRTNRRLINLLTAIRLYHDQTAHSLSSVYGKDSKILNDFRFSASKEYDGKLSYRALEAIRNHVQHASLPITAISFPMNTVERDDSKEHPRPVTRIRYKVVPYIGTESLEENPKFKKTVLEEIKRISNKKNDIEVMPMVREYISSIGRIHAHLRTLIKENLESAAKTINYFRSIAPEISEGLAAIQSNEQGLYTNHISLVDRPIQRWEKLSSKNSSLERVDRSFVSSENE